MENIFQGLDYCKSQVKCNRVGKKRYTSEHIFLSYLFKKLNLIIIRKIKRMKFNSSNAQQTVTGT